MERFKSAEYWHILSGQLVITRTRVNLYTLRNVLWVCHTSKQCPIGNTIRRNPWIAHITMHWYGKAFVHSNIKEMKPNSTVSGFDYLIYCMMNACVWVEYLEQVCSPKQLQTAADLFQKLYTKGRRKHVYLQVFLYESYPLFFLLLLKFFLLNKIAFL